MFSKIADPRRLFWVVLALLATAPGLFAASIPVGGACSLVDAIRSANDDIAVGGCPAGSGADTLMLSADVTLTAVAESFTGENGLPVIRSEITIEGGGFTVERDDAAPAFRIIAVAQAGTLTLNQITVRNGNIDGVFDAGSGGGIWSGDDGALHLTNTTVTENQAGSSGGGILSNSIFTLSHCIVSENRAHVGGGIQTDNAAVMTMDHSTISGNSVTGSGGGLYLVFAAVLIVSSTISHNDAAFAGGGIVVQESRATLRNTTVSGNGTDGDGGGIVSVFFGEIFLENSTVVGNHATLGAGI